MTVIEQLTIDGGAEPFPRSTFSTIGARIPRAEYTALRREAFHRHCSMSAIIREAISDWLNVYGETT